MDVSTRLKRGSLSQMMMVVAVKTIRDLYEGKKPEVGVGDAVSEAPITLAVSAVLVAAAIAGVTCETCSSSSPCFDEKIEANLSLRGGRSNVRALSETYKGEGKFDFIGDFGRMEGLHSDNFLDSDDDLDLNDNDSAVGTMNNRKS